MTLAAALSAYLAAFLLSLAQLWARESTSDILWRVRAKPPLVQAVSGARLTLSVLGAQRVRLSPVGDQWQLQAADEIQPLFPGTRRLLQLGDLNLSRN